MKFLITILAMALSWSALAVDNCTPPLDAQYGSSQLPKYLKQHEFLDRRVADNPCINVNSGLEQSVGHYIWVVTDQGQMIVGKEPASTVDTNQRLGHPTLTGGRPARIAGELNWVVSSGKWKMDCKSGRYSTGLTDRTEAAFNNAKTLLASYLKEADRNALIGDYRTNCNYQ